MSGSWFVHSINRERRAAFAVRVRTNPGIFIGESPRLNRGAAGILQANPYDPPVDVGLSLNVFIR